MVWIYMKSSKYFQMQPNMMYPVLQAEATAEINPEERATQMHAVYATVLLRTEDAYPF